MPKNFVVWFVSPDKTAYMEFLDKKPKFSSMYAQNSLQCQKMGDYCFDPQVGLYKEDDKKELEAGHTVKQEVEVKEIEDHEKYKFLHTASSIDREMVKCQKKQSMFDIFCGKASGTSMGVADNEIWIDVSTTLRQVDPTTKTGTCYRESLVHMIEKSCDLNKQMNVFTFTEDVKRIDVINSVCGYYGLNDMKRMMQDLKNKEIGTLIIITDIFEAEESFINFIERNKGVTRGLKKPLYAKDLTSRVKELTKYCK